MTINTRCGYVAILGRPNVGKSTLINSILGKKLSITSRKPQTTRHRILGIKTVDNTQALYIDTPGIHQSGGRTLNKRMNRHAYNSIQGVDILCFMIEALRWKEEDTWILDKIRDLSTPIILLINKIDQVEKTKLLEFLTLLQSKHPFAAMIPISASKGLQVDALETEVAQHLPYQDFCFPEGTLTNCSERFMLAELIREQLVRHLYHELPYSLAVEMEDGEPASRSAARKLSAVIWVENANQKAIVIGKKGALLKQVGTKARLTIEKYLDSHIHLTLWVKVKPNWPDKPPMLSQQGL